MHSVQNIELSNRDIKKVYIDVISKNEDKYIRNLSYLDEKVSHSPIQILGPLWQLKELQKLKTIDIIKGQKVKVV